MTDDDDKTVKQMIDAATRAELERWFGLPSITQVEEERAQAAPAEDPDVVAVRERREKAIAAVDPAMVEAHRRRTDAPEDLIRFKPMIEIRVDPGVAFLDHAMIERGSIAEPREVEIPDALRDDLRDCTPQALLRDLHRPEFDFDKTFEIIDHAAENRVDVVAIVNEVMTTTYKITTASEPTSLMREGREILRELRTLRLEPWTAERLSALPNRRVNG
jgi:hypothetical protein